MPEDQPDATYIDANGVPHQSAVSVDVRRRENPEYFIPYERAGIENLENVLIVGAGSGTDVAIALSEGAGHIDAVEIDPKLLQIGVDRHPDRPYQDPRVSRFVNDGRAFLEQTDEEYDLILFALPDSLTLVSGQSSLRLESYLFTVQAMESARDHLAPDGVFAMYNFYREDWLVDRLAGTLDQVYGAAPVCRQRRIRWTPCRHHGRPGGRGRGLPRGVGVAGDRCRGRGLTGDRRLSVPLSPDEVHP